MATTALPRSTASRSEPRQAVLRRKKMRGGLGRTLLTAFLLLALGPLSAMSVYAISRTSQERHVQQMEQVALLAESYRAGIDIAWQARAAELSAERAATPWLLDDGWEALDARRQPPLPAWLERTLPPTTPQIGGSPPSLWVAVERPGGWAASTLPLAPLVDQIRLPASLQQRTVYLQVRGDLIPLEGAPVLAGLAAALEEAGEGQAQLIEEGEMAGAVIGRAPLGRGLSLLVVQPPRAERRAPDSLATALVAVALLVALATTVGAAFITRQITRPLYELTRTAVQIARGDLTHRAEVEQDNELGILALAFNTMTAQLQETLETLEERVDQRTEELRHANAEIAARAHQLELGAEIGAVLSGIHDLDDLLANGTRLIANAYGYQDVSVWLRGRRPGRAPGLTLRAGLSSPDAPERDHPAALALQATEGASPVFDGAACALALPLRLADNVLGSMVFSARTPFEARDQQHLQILADTFAVALENARASEMERDALDKLHRIEVHRAQFLGEMSHELSTALNSIIGFSHLLLREVEGPLTDMQRSDLTFINRNGTHLLSLLDGMLDVIDSDRPTEPDEATGSPPSE